MDFMALDKGPDRNAYARDREDQAEAGAEGPQFVLFFLVSEVKESVPRCLCLPGTLRLLTVRRHRSRECRNHNGPETGDQRTEHQALKPLRL
jgi:hypothetical protein